MNSEPIISRPYISVVGRRNVGKSALVNAMLGQDLSIVSEVAGTTTEPIKKAFELLPYGPVVLVDTAGIDDEGELGQKKISKTIKILSSSNFALVVVDARDELQSKELELFAYLDKLQINYVVAVNKIEFGINPELVIELKELRITHFEVSCKEKAGIEELKRRIIRLLPSDQELPLVNDIVSQGDLIVMVVPNDFGAPKGRLILPQVQTIREALDEDTIVVVCKDIELRSTLDSLKNYPDLVIADSQAIMHVAAHVPEKVKLTTFCILMARHKGDLPIFVNGLRRVEELQNGDKVLVAGACMHHPDEDEIGTVKIPQWLRNHTRKDLKIDISHGYDYPENLSDYRLIVHCEGCMLTRREMQTRINEAKLMDVPIVNYGVLSSYIHGAIPRALLPFPNAFAEWEKVQTKKIYIS